MTPLLSIIKPPLLILSTLTLLSQAALGQNVPECTKAEMDNLLLNPNVRACAANYTSLLSKKGCEKGLADQACYCDSPNFMAAVTGCLFNEEPDVQDELLRCGKWYLCDSLESSINKTVISLTPESTELLRKGKIAIAAGISDAASASHLSTAVHGWTGIFVISTIVAAAATVSIF